MKLGLINFISAHTVSELGFQIRCLSDKFNDSDNSKDNFYVLRYDDENYYFDVYDSCLEEDIAIPFKKVAENRFNIDIEAYKNGTLSGLRNKIRHTKTYTNIFLKLDLECVLISDFVEIISLSDTYRELGTFPLSNLDTLKSKLAIFESDFDCYDLLVKYLSDISSMDSYYQINRGTYICFGNDLVYSNLGNYIVWSFWVDDVEDNELYKIVALDATKENVYFLIYLCSKSKEVMHKLASTDNTKFVSF